MVTAAEKGYSINKDPFSSSVLCLMSTHSFKMPEPHLDPHIQNTSHTKQLLHTQPEASTVPLVIVDLGIRSKQDHTSSHPCSQCKEMLMGRQPFS